MHYNSKMYFHLHLYYNIEYIFIYIKNWMEKSITILLYNIIVLQYNDADNKHVK